MKKVFLMCVVIVSISIVFIGFNFMKKTEIRELSNTEGWGGGDPDGVPTAVKCYIIHNPPMDCDELKILVEKYIDDNITEITLSGEENIRYKCFFFRTSKRMPWNWKEDHSYLSEDHIGHHTDDMIVAVYWTTDDHVREYHVMNKSKRYDSYGKLLEEVRYKGEIKEVVEWSSD